MSSNLPHILQFAADKVFVYQHYISTGKKVPITSLAYCLFYEFIVEELESLKEIRSISIDISQDRLVNKLTYIFSKLDYRLYLDIQLIYPEETDEKYLRQLYQFIRKIKRTQSDARSYQIVFSNGCSTESAVYLVDLIFILSLMQLVNVEYNDGNLFSYPKISIKLGEQAIRDGLFLCYQPELPEMLLTKGGAIGRSGRLELRRLSTLPLMKIVQQISQHHGQQGILPIFLSDTIVSFSLFLHHINVVEASDGDEKLKETLLYLQKALNPSYLPYPFDSLLRDMRKKKQVTYSPEKRWIYVPPYEIWSKADLLKNIVWFPGGIRLAEILPQLDKSLESEEMISKPGDDTSMRVLFTSLLNELENSILRDRGDISQTSMPDLSVADTHLSTDRLNQKFSQVSYLPGNAKSVNLAQSQAGTAVRGAGAAQIAVSAKLEDHPSYRLIIAPMLESRELAQCNIALPSGTEAFIFSRVSALSYTHKTLEEGPNKQREREPVFGKLTKAMRGFIFRRRKEIFPAATPELEKMLADLRQLLRIDATTQQTKTRFSHARQAKEWENTHITEEWYLKCKEDRAAH